MNLSTAVLFVLGAIVVLPHGSEGLFFNKRSGGSPCTLDAQCFSGFCAKQLNGSHNCALDSHMKGKIGAGGICKYSGQCITNACIKVGYEYKCVFITVPRNASPQVVSVFGDRHGGSPCTFDFQCFSGYCAKNLNGSYTCATDSSVKGKIGIGGICKRNNQCLTNNCTRFGPETRCAANRTRVVIAAAPGYKVGIGARCYSNWDCITNNCTRGYCYANRTRPWVVSAAAPAPQDLAAPGYKVGIGARCYSNWDCITNNCTRGYCYANRTRPWFVPAAAPAPQDLAAPGYKVGIGSRCNSNWDCITNNCTWGYCYANRTILGQRSGGTPCNFDYDCRSGYCGQTTTGRRCAKDAPIPGKVGGGGICSVDNQCYSGHCVFIGNVAHCADDSPTPGKIGGSGFCRLDKECYSGYCAASSGVKRCAKDSSTEGKVGQDGLCKLAAQCQSGKCKNSKCA